MAMCNDLKNILKYLFLSTVQYNEQIFCKTWHLLNFDFTLIMKFNLENRIFYSCPNMAGFLKNVFKRQIWAHLWLGRENEVARTRFGLVLFEIYQLKYLWLSTIFLICLSRVYKRLCDTQISPCLSIVVDLLYN